MCSYPKHSSGLEFFDFCNGNHYQSLGSRIISLDEHSDNLLNARYAWDNFHNEPPHMRKILSFIKSEADIPKERVEKIIRIVMVCRIGKGISYNDGVSSNGRPLYDKFLNYLGDDNVIHAICAIHSQELSSLLDNTICQNQMVTILQQFKATTRSE